MTKGLPSLGLGLVPRKERSMARCILAIGKPSATAILSDYEVTQKSESPDFRPGWFKKPFIAIAAVAENRVIGNGLNIPWRIKEDFQHFKSTTLGHVLVMGRKTFESIGKPLPGRETIVVSRQSLTIPGVKVVHSLEEAIPPAGDPRTYFICGGAEIYKQALPLCHKLILSHVHMAPDGDVLFPEFESLFQEGIITLENPLFTVKTYQAKPSMTTGTRPVACE